MTFLIKPTLLLLASSLFCGNALAADDNTAADKKLPEAARFFLADDSKLGIDPGKGTKVRAQVAKSAARIKIVPGLTDPQCVSLMTDRDVYLLHRDWKIWAETRPEDAQARRTFDANATFKVNHLPNGEIRLESKNRPGEFLVVETDNNLSLSKPAEGLRLNFRVEGKPAK
ncbi:AbfB domain-containing protein [Luteolibacter yonseiensis]|uniref:AbfB domain-containing protein n=1 Tax=Luteolibacter yonseiensis TaxID=1144680 RepID=A0A934R1R2_9BACT|nr:AbfB domain-containing protein [Luteolibacter yonseiensis]MBK1815204.1 AbfB domain-containing protein [Luteolibacter yonseiensis]